jgi:hypothetical protein
VRYRFVNSLEAFLALQGFNEHEESEEYKEEKAMLDEL